MNQAVRGIEGVVVGEDQAVRAVPDLGAADLAQAVAGVADRAFDAGVGFFDGLGLEQVAGVLRRSASASEAIPCYLP